jgi:hypothetical protein
MAHKVQRALLAPTDHKVPPAHKVQQVRPVSLDLKVQLAHKVQQVRPVSLDLKVQLARKALDTTHRRHQRQSQSHLDLRYLIRFQTLAPIRWV